MRAPSPALAVTFQVRRTMSRICELTGKGRQVGHNVSHSNRHTQRRFEVNLVTKRFWLEGEKR